MILVATARGCLLLLLLLCACRGGNLTERDPGERGRELYRAGRFAEAEPLLRRAAADAERTEPAAPSTAAAINALAILYAVQGRYAEVGPLLQRAMAIQSAASGPSDPDVLKLAKNLANLAYVQGRYAEAEGLYRELLRQQEARPGPGDPDVAGTLLTLAQLYERQGRFREAETLVERALAIREEALGPDHQGVAVVLVELAGLYDAQLRRAEVGPLLARARAIAERAGDGYDRDVISVVVALAGFASRQGRHAEAETLLTRALERQRRALGPENPDVAVSLDNLANSHIAQRRYADAERLLKEARAIFERLLGPDHPELANNANTLAALYDEQGRPDEALVAARRATAVRQRWLDANAPSSGRDPVGALHGPILATNLIRAAWRVAARGAAERPFLFDEAFRAGQGARASDAAAAVARVAARFATGDDALARLVRDREDRATRVRALDGSLIEALGRTPAERDTTGEDQRRRELEEARGVLDETDRRLARDFPGYQELTRPEPVGVREVRDLLLPGEALLAYSVSGVLVETDGDLREDDFLWLVRPDRVEMYRLDTGPGQLEAGLAEPALVLTPPATATEADDGLLTASEAARLKLDADLVLLSACNTAAPDGTPGAPGLSGLAKAFIYAGASSLLVSHWAVVSDAAQLLTTAMFAELARDPALGRAEALRRAEMALLDDPPQPALAHPAAWAPFVVVGEGAARP